MDKRTTDCLVNGFRLQGKTNTYIIDKVLGQGAFGITYLARFKSTIQGDMGKGSGWIQVAVKEFFMKDMNVREGSTGYLNDVSQDSLVGRYRRAFMREARNLASLHHPNIVNVFEVIEANNTVYIVMEYINGGSLDDHILKNGQLTEQESLDGIHKICSAVSCMHSNKILHLDIKPKNIMLDEEGELYLIDFGLSKQYSENGEPESSTSIGLGTPGYAPIEQAEHQDGDKTFRATLDIYALGATLFKMLTGNTPPKASQVSDSVIDGNNIITEQLKKAGISDSLISVVTKAMWPSSRGRYQSVEEFDKALNDIKQPSTQPVHEDIIEVESTQIVSEQPVPASTPVAEKDDTVVISDTLPVKETKAEKKDEPTPTAKQPFEIKDNEDKKKSKTPIIFAIIGAIIFIVIAIAKCDNDNSKQTNSLKKYKATVSGSESGHDYVDLGLSVMWATCNIGADKPEKSGDYYAWGEIETKKEYNWRNYKFYIQGDSVLDIKLARYNTIIYHGIPDGTTILDNEDDVASVLWNGGWRMPTQKEYKELIDNCTWTWESINGIEGYIVKSNKPGFTDNFIFLPVGGIYCEGEIVNKSWANYWTKDLYWVPTNSCILAIDSTGYSCNKFYSQRYMGQFIRPVLNKDKTKGVKSDLYDICLQSTGELLIEGETCFMIPSLFPSNLTDVTLTWSSSDNKVATVDNKGKVVALKKGKTTITVSSGDINSSCEVEVVHVTNLNNFTYNDYSGIENGHKYVDLGLSVKWATNNLGTNEINGFGERYAWGEITNKNSYTPTNYYYRVSGDSDGNNMVFSKYYTQGKIGTQEYKNNDYKLRLDINDDVANIKWSGNWRMPTAYDFLELITSCAWTWTSYNGIKGYRIRSRLRNFESCYFFLPSTFRDSQLGDYGLYWSCDLSRDDNSNAYALIFTSDWLPYYYYEKRYEGLFVRPVCP